jgi:hypothetical protein
VHSSGAKKNSSPPRARSLLDRLREENALDTELYNWVLDGMPEGEESKTKAKQQSNLVAHELCNPAELARRNANVNPPGRLPSQRLMERELVLYPVTKEDLTWWGVATDDKKRATQKSVKKFLL